MQSSPRCVLQALSCGKGCLAHHTSDAVHAHSAFQLKSLTVRLSLAAWRTDVKDAEFFSPAARGTTGRSMLWWMASSSLDRIPRCSLFLLESQQGGSAALTCDMVMRGTLARLEHVLPSCLPGH